MNLTADELRKLFPRNTLSLPGNDRIAGLSQDTRRLRPGELYVAVQGENFDGHDFVAAAFAKGACAALVRDGYADRPDCLYCSDTVKGLGEIASFHRAKFAQPLVAVTGSSGKTTNKELLSHVLGRFGGTIATEGNLNNHIGVPLTIARFTERARFFVVEMGMNHPGEIRYLTRMARPTVALITNVGPAHMEGVGGTIEGVAKAKGELFEELDAQATAVVNLDDALVAALPTRAAKITFGFDVSADVRAENFSAVPEGSRFTLVWRGERIPVTLKLSGAHHVRNALAAFAVGKALGLETSGLVAGLESFEISSNRGRVIVKARAAFVDDTYNANPDSMRAAFEALVQRFPKARKVGVLGGMLELGPASIELHRGVGRDAKKIGLDEIYSFGGDSAGYLEGFGYSGAEAARRKFTDHAAMADAVGASLKGTGGAAVLVKGSRGMRMEEVLKKLLEREAG